MNPGMKAAMTRIFNDYARRVNLLKEKDKNLEGSDIREGLSAVLSIRVPEKSSNSKVKRKRN